MKRLVALLSGLVLCLPAMAAGNLADVRIFDRTSGRMLPVHESGGRWFVAGKPGNEYRISVRNRSGSDLLAVISVDGVNVVSGETAAQWQSGYVVGKGSSLSVQGWRKSLENVAAFYFTDLGDSYAARTGRPDNVGVIGVALFKRKPAQPAADVAEPKAREDWGAGAQKRAQPAPQAAEKSIGTGHGRIEASGARYVEFERESDVPNELIAIHYDTHANLVARGIIREERRWPSPFPGGFVPDPPA
jgi:hypothetical protein